MKVIVIRWGTMESLPPASSLVRALVSLGHEVTLLCNHLPGASIADIGQACTIDLGEYPAVGSSNHLVTRVKSLLALRKSLKGCVDTADIVWTTSDNSAVYCLDIIPPEKHILQLAELVEYVPLVGSASLFKSKRFIEQARLAKRVVVPEINRAFIQKAWWNLPTTPAVLPNKPWVDCLERHEPFEEPKYIALMDRLASQGKKIVLYQGGFTEDRDLETYCKAIELLGREYVFCLMGPSNDYQLRLCEYYGQTAIYLGCYQAPRHLYAGMHADVGILPYKSNPGKVAHLSPLNSLFCAPNKLWEYALVGLPMVANNLPGIKGVIERNGLGCVAVEGNPESAAKAIVAVCDERERFSACCKQFYSSVDIVNIIDRILTSSVA